MGQNNLDSTFDSTSVAPYLQNNDLGFQDTTLRAFLNKHSDPKSLLAQIYSLYEKHEFANCKGIIDVICEQRHPLIDDAELFLLRVRIAFEEDNHQELEDWLVQARRAEKPSASTLAFESLRVALMDISDGLYDDAIKKLIALTSNPAVGSYAHYELGKHFLWKSNSTVLATYHLNLCLDKMSGLTQAWANLGFAHDRLNEKESAQKCFAKCIELESNPEKRKFYQQHLAS